MQNCKSSKVDAVLWERDREHGFLESLVVMRVDYSIGADIQIHDTHRNCSLNDALFSGKPLSDNKQKNIAREVMDLRHTRQTVPQFCS